MKKLLILMLKYLRKNKKFAKIFDLRQSNLTSIGLTLLLRSRSLWRIPRTLEGWRWSQRSKEAKYIQEEHPGKMLDVSVQKKTLQWLKSVPQLFQQKQWIGQMKQMWCITFTCFNKYLGLLPRWTNIEILIKHKFYLNYIHELWQNQVWQVFIKYDS